jgi:stearoyl-CoA desaturase (delta-9 desaturase)
MNIIKKDVLIFIASIYLFALIGLFFYYTNLDLNKIIFHVSYLFLGVLFFNAGWHRYFVHKSFKTSKWFQFILYFFGSMTFIGSLIEWIDDHRNHHLFLNTEKDPTNRTKGWLYSHLGWSWHYRELSNKKLFLNPFLEHVHKYKNIYPLLSAFIIPLSIDYLFFNETAMYSITFSCLRIMLQQNIIALLGSECHSSSIESESKNNLFVSVLCLGEGYQKNHHETPIDYRHGKKYFDFDPTKWFIFILYKIGFVWDLKYDK